LGGSWAQPRVIPTDREIKAFEITTEALDGWKRVFAKRRRRLVRFLRTAARSEEDLAWGIFGGEALCVPRRLPMEWEKCGGDGRGATDRGWRHPCRRGAEHGS
jgi:hypothetical protein